LQFLLDLVKNQQNLDHHIDLKTGMYKGRQILTDRDE